MKFNLKFTPFWMLSMMLIILGLTYHSSLADTNVISLGPWIFDEADFADQVLDLDPIKQIRVDTIENCTGTESELGTQRFQECLNLTLAGYTPDTFFVNMGSSGDTASNQFQVNFTDVKAENHFGPDIVLFECHFNAANSFEIAVHVEGESDFTDFVTYDASYFQETDSVCYDPVTNWGLQIDLSDFEYPPGSPLPSSAVVDAIQIKSVDPDPGDPNISPEGEPSMVAVLSHAISIPAVHLPIIFKP